MPQQPFPPSSDGASTQSLPPQVPPAGKSFMLKLKHVNKSLKLQGINGHHHQQVISTALLDLNIFCQLISY